MTNYCTNTLHLRGRAWTTDQINNAKLCIAGNNGVDIYQLRDAFFIATFTSVLASTDTFDEARDYRRSLI